MRFRSRVDLRQAITLIFAITGALFSPHAGAVETSATKKTYVAFFMGQGGFVFSWGIPMLASRAHELGLEADIFPYYDLRAAWKKLARKKKQGYKVALVGYSLGNTTATYIQKHVEIDLLLAIAQSSLGRNHRINKGNTKRSVLWWGPDFLSNAGRKNGFDEINYINNLHLWIDVDPRVVNSVLAELWGLKQGKIEPAPLPQPIQNTPDTGAPILVASADGDRWPVPSGRYSPLHAAGAYQLRRRREALIEKDRALRSFVLDRLAEGWTPEQIAGWLKAGNERRLRAVGCETIYAFIYRAAQKAEQLWRYLTRRHKRRRPRRSRPSRDTIKDRVSIHERPENIDARTEAGHWEGDLIICKRTRPVLILYERKSRVTLAARLVGKTAAETISVMLAVFARIEPTLRKSITFDNDTAFAQHARLKTMCAMTTWFCDAYASWQKGGVENANGRLRRWLRVRSTLTKCPTKKSRISSSPPISRRENASVSRRHSRQSSKSLAKTSKFGFHKPVAPRSRIHSGMLPGAVMQLWPSKPIPTAHLFLPSIPETDRNHTRRTVSAVHSSAAI